MPTYSFIMEFRGGTYISQTQAIDVKNAVMNWANELEVNQIKHLGLKSKEILINELPERIAEGEIVAIDEVKNIWIFLYIFKSGFATIHIFKTDITPEIFQD